SHALPRGNCTAGWSNHERPRLQPRTYVRCECRAAVPAWSLWMTTTTDVQTLSFEEALAELEMLIAQLERGDVKLNDAVQAYQRGSQLANRCAQLLDETEATVTQLVVGAQGALQERPFAAAGAEAPAAAAPSSFASPAAPRPVAPPPPTAPVRARAGVR